MSGINTNYNNNSFNYPIQENKEPIDESKLSGLGINEKVAELKEEVAEKEVEREKAKRELDTKESNYHKFLENGGDRQSETAIAMQKEIVALREKVTQLDEKIKELKSEIDKLNNQTSIHSNDNNLVSEPSQDTKPLTGLFSLIREQTRSS